MPYEFYKIFHVVSLFLLMGVFTASMLIEPPKWMKIFSGILSLLIFVAGMGLIARIGISHGAGWPLWLKVKVGMWLFLAAWSPIATKRFKNNRPLAFGVFYGIVVVAAVMAVYQVGD